MLFLPFGICYLKFTQIGALPVRIFGHVNYKVYAESFSSGNSQQINSGAGEILPVVVDVHPPQGRRLTV
jgi:hypothetical protein